MLTICLRKHKAFFIPGVSEEFPVPFLLYFHFPQDNSIYTELEFNQQFDAYQTGGPFLRGSTAYAAEVYTIGSAVRAGNAMAATKEGYEVGMKL